MPPGNKPRTPEYGQTARPADKYSRTHGKPLAEPREICLTYFEICALYFFLAPGRGKRAENQFSFFGCGKRRFRAPVLHSGIAFFLEDFLPRVVPFRQKVLPLQPISTRVDRFVLLATTKKQC